MKRIRLLTLNIRRDEGDDGINNWEFRQDLVATILKKYNPDIAVFQEVLAHQLEDLKSMLPGYEHVGVGRDDGLAAGEFSPIFYKGLTIEKQGTFWLSDTPDKPSTTWPGMVRICTWASFTGEIPFAVFNTHFEYEFEITQMKSVELLKERTGFYPEEYPILLTGDFNFNPGTAPYNCLNQFFADSFSNDGKSISVSNHEWNGRTEPSPGKSDRIDYVWNRGNLKVIDCKILTDNPATKPGVYPSDHRPVLCDLLLKEN